MSDQIRIEKTGKVFAVSSAEFVAIFPEGTVKYLWSPIWHQRTETDQERIFLEKVEKLWIEEQEKILNA